MKRSLTKVEKRVNYKYQYIFLNLGIKAHSQTMKLLFGKQTTGYTPLAVHLNALRLSESHKDQY